MKSVVAPWLRPPESLTCDRSAAHVWRAALDVPSSHVRRLSRVLSLAELERGERFWFPRDRERYIVARAVLKSVLGRYLGVGPGEIRFEHTPYGKPGVEGEGGRNGLRFSISHAPGLALYAVSRGREIGVDVERLRGVVGGLGVAERFFSSREVAMLRQLPAEMYTEAFLACWTRNEAYLKARGVGFLGMRPGEPGETSGWTVQNLSPGPGYVGALAAEGNDWRLFCWDWPGGLPGVDWPICRQDSRSEAVLNGAS
ncbi:MAG: 4'-phosphopantetheinyl transferase superfamily protein [Candidatus Rokubacteria bacterium]|nr:4'-phosphopantetheinyl transferase superfamily protein [Candidatus Rokubacteria bacterium]